MKLRSLGVIRTIRALFALLNLFQLKYVLCGNPN